MMLKLAVGIALVTLVACSQCPDSEVCEAGQSCCQAPTGELSCCPFHHGECCADHLHCCPEFTLCQATQSMCVNATHSLPWLERMPAKQSSLPKSFRMITSIPGSENDITCPDGSYCPAEFSCLLMSSGYGCCPVAQGNVCSDGKHCCPKGHKCSTDSSSCVKNKEPVKTVICGDGKSECPMDSTCCETEVGQWACCPMPKAVCCDDKIHCCPEDSVCDVKSSKCLSSTNQELPMWSKFPARLRAEWEDHKPAAITPEKSNKAEPTTNTQTTTTLNQMTTLSTVSLKSSDVPCNDTAACPDEYTCCKTKEGEWSCCPLPQAVCCDDFLHCCPHGKKCNLAAGKCEDPSGSVPWLEKVPVKPIKNKSVVVKKGFNVPCDDTVACPDDTTCCKTKEGGWGCCPLPQAVCCEDFLHCCPHDTKCNITADTCDDPSGSVPWLEKVPARPIKSKNVANTTGSDVPCDHTAACPDEYTCCKTKEGGWACCPLPQAVCCEDFLHCCPTGKKCNITANTCEDPSGSVPWLEKVPAKPIKNKNLLVKKGFNVPCDDTVACPDDTTCCKTKEGGWGCCPLPKAVCCEDFLHCCPHDTKCNITADTCDDPSGSVPWLEKVPARPIKSKNVANTTGSDVPCDHTVACPDEYTCCKTKEGGWACCPLPQAVCCEDFLHCCPTGKKCNITANTCEDPSGSVPWLEKVPAKPIKNKNLLVKKGFNVPCDDTVACPDDTTCCKTKEGGWGCCPLPKAVCCEDFLHCCPHGTKCNITADTCDDPSGSVPWLEKVPARPIKSKNVSNTTGSDVPCDHTVACPDEYTCCKTKEGGWACCPLPQAVCCEDFLHCCPTGKKCNITANTCEDPSGSVPWLEKVPAKPIKNKNLLVKKGFNVPCDDTVACPDDTTCCKTKEGGWGCCPLPKAVCCEDFLHCCPHGTKCNITADTCDDPSGSVPWLEKVPAQPIKSKNVSKTKGSNVPCDDAVACPDEYTCCKTRVGDWACCPLPQAVCCDDFIHCCPNGKKCNNTVGKCEDASGSVPWLEKVPVKPIKNKNVANTKGSDVPCDHTAACPDDTTCCKTKDGGWACCPLPQAVCCEDFVHCCPHDTKCNNTADTCDGPSGSVPWLEKVPAHPRAGQRSSGNVSCDSNHACPESNTCCKDIDGKWACCPMPQAVCCWDHFHCCPQGTTCDLLTLTCKSNTTSVPMSELNPGSDKEKHKQETRGEVKEGVGEMGKYKNRVPCDAHTSCPDHTTCCLSAETKKWGCCPLPNAVCCKDGKHCCPTNYKCDMSKVSCIKEDVVIPWYNKIGAQRTPAPSSDPSAIRCDAQTGCPVGSTCCRLKTGQWGCCPHPEAVCCPDQEHCCPRGFSCDLTSHSCVKTIWLQVDTVPLSHIRGLEPQPSISRKDIQCGGGYRCLKSETCCPTSENTWGCCPSLKAMCCDDMKHCCPAGYKCGDSGTCTQATGFNWNSWSVFFSKKKRALLV